MPDVCRVLPEQISQDLQQWQTKTSQSREERSRADRRARYLFGAALPFRPPRLHPARLQVKARRRPRQFAHAALGGPGEAVAHSDGLVHREDNFARVGRAVGGEVVRACRPRPDEDRTNTNGTRRAGGRRAAEAAGSGQAEDISRDSVCRMTQSQGGEGKPCFFKFSELSLPYLTAVTVSWAIPTGV